MTQAVLSAIFVAILSACASPKPTALRQTETAPLASIASSKVPSSSARTEMPSPLLTDKITSGNSSVGAVINSPAPNPKNFETDLSDWEAIADEDGVKTYRQKNAQEGIVAFRGEKIIHASMKKIA